MVDNVEYQKRNSRIAFVFSCPGRNEEREQTVCSGPTGKNLDDMLCYCHHKMADVFPSESKDDYTITNAVTRVYYLSLNGKTEAKDADILDDANQKRLLNELSEYDYVIAMGDKAKLAIELLPIKGKKIYSEHLSPRHLNSTYTSDLNTPPERRLDMLHYVADSIIEEINKGEM